MSSLDDLKEGLKTVIASIVNLTTTINAQNIIQENRTTKLEIHVKNIYHEIKELKQKKNNGKQKKNNVKRSLAYWALTVTLFVALGTIVVALISK